MMRRNLIGFGSYSGGSYSGSDIADPRPRFTRIVSQPSTMATTAPATAQASQPGAQYITGSPLYGGRYTVDTGTAGAQNYVDTGSGQPGTAFMPERAITGPKPEPEMSIMPGELPELFTEGGDGDSQPSATASPSTSNLLVYGLLAAAVLAGGYWFFVAKKPKKEK